MSHGLWRNLITVLLYKARPLTVNTAANSVIDTAALSESNMFYGVNSLVKKGFVRDIIQLSVLNFTQFTGSDLSRFFQRKQAVIQKLKNDLLKIITFSRN